MPRRRSSASAPRPGPCGWPRRGVVWAHARSCHRFYRPEPDRPCLQRVPERRTAGRSRRGHDHGGPRRNSGVRRRRRAGPRPGRHLSGVRRAKRRGRLQHGPRGQHPGRAGQRSGRHHQPFLCLQPADAPDGVPRRQGRRRPGVRGRRGGGGVALPGLGRCRRDRRQHAQSALRGGPETHRGPRGRQHAVDRPAAGRPDAGRVHRHGPDGGERRHKLRHHPRGAGRLGGAQPEPGRGGHRFRVLRPRNHALHPRRRLGGRPRRFTAARRDGRGGRCPAAGLPQRRHRDGRERVPAQ